MAQNVTLREKSGDDEWLIEGLNFGDQEDVLDSNGNEVLEFNVVASAVNHIEIGNAATGNNPTIACNGEADTGITVQNSEGEEIVILDSVASSVNELTIRSAATGNKPIIAATGEADNGIEFHNDQAEEILILNSVASSVNEITVSSAATGNKPIIAATGEADNGIAFHNDQAEEILILQSAPTSVNEITITSAATGVFPKISCTGEVDTGITFSNSESEEIVILDSIATSVNEFTISSAATGNGPQLAATGGDSDINVEIIPKGVGYVDIQNGGVQVVAQSVTPDNNSDTASTIENGAIAIDVGAVTNDANDWVVLPALASVPVGHTIKIACNAGGNFELRTPASSSEKINNENCDGTKEYLCTDTDTVIIWKLSATDGWIAQSITALGAVRTAVVPD